jgi:N utilization substance protein B
LQALYSWQIGGEPPHVVEAYYRAENDLRKTDGGYFQELFREVIARAAALDESFALYLDRPVRELDPIELAILRIGSFELLHRVDVPPRVAINEGIELAKEFGATDESHKFINGVLDKVARKVRAAEFAARS